MYIISKCIFNRNNFIHMYEYIVFVLCRSDGEDDADEDMENEGTFERSKKRARTETDAEGKQNEKTKSRPVRLSQALASERASNRSILQFFGRGSAAPDAPPAHLKPPAALEPWADPRAADKFCLNNFSTFTPH